MSKHPPGDDSKRELDHTLHDLNSKLHNSQIADMIWDRALVREEQKRLGSDFNRRDLPQEFARLRGYSLKRAVVDLALKVSLLDVGMHEMLRYQIGEPVENVDDRPRPKWDAQRGELSFLGEIIQTVSKRGTNQRPILDAFEEQRWQTQIANPLPGGKKSKKLRDTLSGLNKGLKLIKFYADGAAAGIRWSEL